MYFKQLNFGLLKMAHELIHLCMQDSVLHEIVSKILFKWNLEKKHVMNWAQNFIKKCLFMHVFFKISILYYFCYTCRRHWKNFIERKQHKLYEMLKSNKNICFHTNASIGFKTKMEMCFISQYENIHNYLTRYLTRINDIMRRSAWNSTEAELSWVFSNGSKHHNWLCPYVKNY